MRLTPTFSPETSRGTCHWCSITAQIFIQYESHHEFRRIPPEPSAKNLYHAKKIAKCFNFPAFSDRKNQDVQVVINSNDVTDKRVILMLFRSQTKHRNFPQWGWLKRSEWLRLKSKLTVLVCWTLWLPKLSGLSMEKHMRMTSVSG